MHEQKWTPRRQAQEELDQRLPRGLRGSEQNWIRQAFINFVRPQDLKRDPLTPFEESRAKAVESARKHLIH